MTAHVKLAITITYGSTIQNLQLYTVFWVMTAIVGFPIRWAALKSRSKKVIAANTIGRVWPPSILPHDESKDQRKS